MGNDSKNDHDALFLGLLRDLKEDVKDVGEKVSKTEDCVKDLQRAQEKNSQAIHQEIQKINVLDEKQNEMLGEHIKRSDLLETDLKLRAGGLDIRVSRLEAPLAWLSGAKRVILTLGGLITAMGAIIWAINRFFF